MDNVDNVDFFDKKKMSLFLMDAAGSISEFVNAGIPETTISKIVNVIIENFAQLENGDEIALQYGEMFFATLTQSDKVYQNWKFSRENASHKKYHQFFLFEKLRYEGTENSTEKKAIKLRMKVAETAANVQDSLSNNYLFHAYAIIRKNEYEKFLKINKLSNILESEATFYHYETLYETQKNPNLKKVIDDVVSVAKKFPEFQSVKGVKITLNTKPQSGITYQQDFFFKTIKDVALFAKLAYKGSGKIYADEDWNQVADEFSDSSNVNAEEFAALSYLLNRTGRFTQNEESLQLAKEVTACVSARKYFNFANVFSNTGCSAEIDFPTKEIEESLANLDVKSLDTLELKGSAEYVESVYNIYKIFVLKHVDIAKFREGLQSAFKNERQRVLYQKQENGNIDVFIPYVGLSGDERRNFKLKTTIRQDNKISIHLPSKPGEIDKEYFVKNASFTPVNEQMLCVMDLVDVQKPNDESTRTYLPILSTAQESTTSNDMTTDTTNALFVQTLKQIVEERSISGFIHVPTKIGDIAITIDTDKDSNNSLEFTQKVLKVQERSYPKGNLVYRNPRSGLDYYYLPYNLDQKKSFVSYLMVIKAPSGLYINLPKKNESGHESYRVENVGERDNLLVVTAARNGAVFKIPLNIDVRLSPKLITDFTSLLKSPFRKKVEEE